jgi:Gliding motility associated protein GldN
MRNLLFVLLLTYLPFSLTAQLDDLLKNPDLSYVATFETEHDFRLSTKRQTSQFQLLKYDFQQVGCLAFTNDNWLAQWMLKGLLDGKISAYQDAELSKAYDKKAIYQRISFIDTVITFDPNTYAETVQIIRNDLNSDDIVSFKTSQAIFYDKKSGSYQTQLLALAPMVKQTDNNGQVIGKSPLAWLPMDGKLPSGFSAQNSDVAWAALLLDKANLLNTSQLKVKKDETKRTFAEQLLVEAASMNHPIESSEGYGCGNWLEKNEVEHMLSIIDTIITFDPATNKESVQVVKNTIRPTDMNRLILVQEWYFDKRRNMLANRLKAIAPYTAITNANNEFMYDRIQFYLHF